MAKSVTLEMLREALVTEVPPVDYSKFDQDGVQVQDPAGFELPDPVPVAPPLGYIKQPSMFDIIRAQVQQQLSAIALAEGFETFEEAEDFDVGDDFDPISPHEGVWELSAAEIRDALLAAQAQKRGVQGESPPAVAPEAPKEPPAEPKAAEPPKAP